MSTKRSAKASHEYDRFARNISNWPIPCLARRLTQVNLCRCLRQRCRAFWRLTRAWGLVKFHKRDVASLEVVDPAIPYVSSSLGVLGHYHPQIG